MSKRLHPVGSAQRLRILKRDNYTCQYCFEGATTIDHILPYSYKPVNTDANLVASCIECNSLAWNIVFTTFNEKYMYIKRRRQQRDERVNPAWQARAVRAMMAEEVPKPAKVIKPPKVKLAKPPKPKAIKPTKVRFRRPAREKVVRPPKEKNLDTQIRISVTAELRDHIRSLKNGSSWRALKDEIPGWRWSYAMLADLANGRQKLTNLAVYEVLGLSLPTVLIMLPDEWARHSMKCDACGQTTTRWHPAQKYCNTECRLRARAERRKARI